jgi:hypothetical protein
MADCARIFINFVIVASRRSFVAKEMNFFKTVFFDKTKSVGFVPTLWKYVNTNLTT